jgi:predicted kinase
MNTLILTVGLPRSGKSTWARQQPYPIVNPDAIRLALYGQAFIADAEQMIWAMARYMVKALFLAGHTTVILDATNVTKKRRDEWQDTLLWATNYKVFNTSKEECIERAKSNNRIDLISVINRMADEFSLEGIVNF